MKSSLVLVLLGVLGIGIYSSAFIVEQGEQALLTQFGKVVGAPITTAGLKWKVPLIQQVRYFDKRILEWDGEPNQIPTLDKKYIWVDTTARWRIKGLVQFAETLRSQQGAQARLDSIIDGATRDVISKHNLVEAVRNSNAIISRLEARREELAKKRKESKLDVEEEVTGEVEHVRVGREQLSRMILERARDTLEPLGVELIDVQFRRIAYEKSVEQKVYDRMISERKRIAEKIRSIGKGEMAKIQGTLNKDLKKIESEAYRESQEIRGKAEAEAIAVYAKALKKDEKFFDFIRTMDAYKVTLKKKGELILSTRSDFLKYLN